MNSLLMIIESLMHDDISNIIQERILQFSKVKHDDFGAIFKELCFCIMTANCNADKCIEIHEKIGEEFIYSDEQSLIMKFKEYGYRFPNIRASYIINARKSEMELKSKLNDSIEENALREWLVKNVKGLGYKEASHFLRNIGYKNLAIIDFHIMDILLQHNLIIKPKCLNKTRYLEIENVLKSIANKLGLTLAELDLYLWYLETGKVLK